MPGGNLSRALVDLAVTKLPAEFFDSRLFAQGFDRRQLVSHCRTRLGLAMLKAHTGYFKDSFLFGGNVKETAAHDHDAPHAAHAAAPSLSASAAAHLRQYRRGGKGLGQFDVQWLLGFVLDEHSALGRV